ncbi:hypothetical protein HK105_200096 [Polyrhizophydium stewartii]|uniref:Uncharacterized protein n=1 Tax=Polyrhizophydium stewartii TaxID=2732419 RepID=A0ABR4NKI9_9FUNG
MPAIEDPEWRQPQNPPLPRDLSTFLMPLPADSFISMVNASGDMPKVFTGAFHVPGAATLDPKTPPRMPAAVLSCAGASSATPGSPATVLTSQLIKPSLPPDSSAASFLTPTASVIGHVSVAPVSPQSALVPGLSSSPPTAVEMVPSMTETTTSLDMPAQVPSATTAVAETPHVEVSQAQTRVPLQHPAISRAQSYDDVAKIVSLGRSPSVRFQAFLDQTIFAEFDNPYDRMLADSATLNTALNLNDGSGEAGVPSMP